MLYILLIVIIVLLGVILMTVFYFNRDKGAYFNKLFSKSLSVEVKRKAFIDSGFDPKYLPKEYQNSETHINIFKCQLCRMEFAIFSWKNNWTEVFKPFCPECGKQNSIFLKKSISDKPICVIVNKGTLEKE